MNEPVLPPTVLHAEQAVLGILLHAPASQAGHAVRSSLQPKHFADPVHASIYEAACRLARKDGDKLNFNELAAEIAVALDEVGGKSYLDHLVLAKVAPENAEAAISAVYDAWARRELITLGGTVSELGIAAVKDALDAAGTRGPDQAAYLVGRLRGILAVLESIAEHRL